LNVLLSAVYLLYDYVIKPHGKAGKLLKWLNKEE
jgi:hypothetical protein